MNLILVDGNIKIVLKNATIMLELRSSLPYNKTYLDRNDVGVKSPFGAKPTQICVFASLLATPHIVFGWCTAPG